MEGERNPPTALRCSNVAQLHQQVGNYCLLKTLGEGNFGQVKLALNVETYEEVAIKIIQKTRLSPASLQMVRNVVNLSGKTAITRAGDLFDYIAEQQELFEEEAQNLFHQAENILLDSNGNIKVADFGLATIYGLGAKLKLQCGTLSHQAPEILLAMEYEGPQVDIWSMGVILFNMVCGYRPFVGQNHWEICDQAISRSFTVPPYVSTECEALIRKILVPTPSERATLEEILQDPWLNILSNTDLPSPPMEPEQDHLVPLSTACPVIGEEPENISRQETPSPPCMDNALTPVASDISCLPQPDLMLEEEHNTVSSNSSSPITDVPRKTTWQRFCDRLLEFVIWCR
ncbi:MAP/microtubule affinity-regulating kinase 4-like [Bombina bombina]|uniref:MAP/microtubule affinity-regulating kinase 4-like n=1 Tax=Bombina bombina TaxID=8345 RepID=UPI00235A6FCD|nr:MAP/microtubule affinity-regulating kinase 4-like [Bombina bombina]